MVCQWEGMREAFSHFKNGRPTDGYFEKQIPVFHKPILA